MVLVNKSELNYNLRGERFQNCACVYLQGSISVPVKLLAKKTCITDWLVWGVHM